jgi:hypothetical protein
MFGDEPRLAVVSTAAVEDGRAAIQQNAHLLPESQAARKR